MAGWSLSRLKVGYYQRTTRGVLAARGYDGNALACGFAPAEGDIYSKERTSRKDRDALAARGVPTCLRCATPNPPPGIVAAHAAGVEAGVAFSDHVQLLVCK